MDDIEFSRRLDEATQDLGVLIANRFAGLHRDVKDLIHILELVYDQEITFFQEDMEDDVKELIARCRRGLPEEKP
jgi:hypothetical protein